MMSGSYSSPVASATLILILTLVACGDERSGGSQDPTRIASMPATPAISTAPASPAPAPTQAPGRVSTPDAALAGKVKSALAAHHDVNAIEIDVVATQGVVTLYGTAPTHASRDRAARVASSIDGVKSVTNKLAVVAGS